VEPGLADELTDQDLVVSGVGTDESVLWSPLLLFWLSIFECWGGRIERTAVGQNGLAALSNQSEGRGKGGGSDGADEAGDSSDGEFHFQSGRFG
jgi:hypothetical protein